ncbi:MAG: IS66 family insertion sequence element accessory protein TnpB [Halopseudomonas sp.]
MIQITPQMRILVAIQPADFRRGIDGIARLCRERFEVDPLSGTVFVFRNRRATAIKILVYDGYGFWLCQKRLSRGHFRHWPSSDTDAGKALLAHELQVLICGGDPQGTRTPPPWRSLHSLQ